MGGFFTVMVIAFVIWALTKAGNKNKKALADAHTAYHQSLAALKADPTNADLKQRTLALGRAYSNLTRNKKGQTIFDEIALMNDINAACAGANVNASTSELAVRRAMADGTVEERLAKLASLYKSGLIDANDFSRRKNEILDSI